MECIVCGKQIKGKDVENIAITDEGEPAVICDECYLKVSIFFEVKRNGKSNSRRSNERSEQKVQI